MKSKFRIFDILIIAVVVASVLLFAKKINFADGRKNALEASEKAEMTVVVPYIDKDIASAIKVGAPFKDVLQLNNLGTIKDIKLDEIDEDDFTFDGKLLSFDKDRYKRLTVTVEVLGKKTEKGILIGGTNYLVWQTNTFSAGPVELEDVRVSGINYLGQ